MVFLREWTCRREKSGGSGDVKMVTGMNRHKKNAAGIRELVNIKQ
jgi:hypothetical protein